MSRRVPATGILTELPLARLKPAVGEMSRQAPPKPRGLFECPGSSEFHNHNPNKARDRRQVADPRAVIPGASHVVRSGLSAVSGKPPGVRKVIERG